MKKKNRAHTQKCIGKSMRWRKENKTKGYIVVGIVCFKKRNERLTQQHMVFIQFSVSSWQSHGFYCTLFTYFGYNVIFSLFNGQKCNGLLSCSFALFSSSSFSCFLLLLLLLMHSMHTHSIGHVFLFLFWIHLDINRMAHYFWRQGENGIHVKLQYTQATYDYCDY